MQRFYLDLGQLNIHVLCSAHKNYIISDMGVVIARFGLIQNNNCVKFDWYRQISYRFYMFVLKVGVGTPFYYNFGIVWFELTFCSALVTLAAMP